VPRVPGARSGKGFPQGHGAAKLFLLEKPGRHHRPHHRNPDFATSAHKSFLTIDVSTADFPGVLNSDKSGTDTQANLEENLAITAEWSDLDRTDDGRHYPAIFGTFVQYSTAAVTKCKSKSVTNSLIRLTTPYIVGFETPARIAPKSSRPSAAGFGDDMGRKDID
jgi:hypothetical protein